MIKITKVYTKTGDKGQTNSACGKRISKSHPAFVLVGKIDYLNSMLGLVRSHATRAYPSFQWMDEALCVVQNELFQIGAFIMTFDEKVYQKRKPLETSQIERLENQMDDMSKNLPPLNNFIISSGHPLAAQLNLARCATREAEGLWWATRENFHPNELIPVYLNRLSDYFFVLSRFVNRQAGEKESLWGETAP